MKSKINPRLLFSSTFISPIVAVLTLTAPVASADTLNSTVDLRVVSGNSGNDTGTLSLYNDGGGNVQHIFLNFDLSIYSGNSITTDATLTLRGDASYGGNLTGVSLGTANAAWNAGTINYSNQPGLTAIVGATNPNGNFGSVDVTWNIPWFMVEKLATTGSGYNSGLGITSGAGSSLHFKSTAGGGPAPALDFFAVNAGSSTWTGGDGNWTDTANWAGSTVAEGINQTATINGGTAVNITLDANRSVGSLVFSGADHTISDGAGKLALNVTSGSPTISVATGQIATIAATVVGIDGLTKTGAGTLTLTGANTHTGATVLTDGVLSVTTIGNGGAASGNLGSATSAAANLVFDGGTLQYTGATDTTNRNFTINAGKTATFDVTANNLTLTGTAPATNGGLTKTGAGALTIEAAQIYTGSTTVNGGGLTFTAGGSIAAASNIQFNSGTLAITSRTLANNMVLNGGAVMVQVSEDNTGTGGAITFSMGNVVHTFTTSGSLVLPTSVGSVSEMIVGAGGGGGAGAFGNVYNAGGGGGRVLNLTGQSLASGSTAVVVGAGGAGGNNAPGTSGGASSIGANTATGGSGAVGNQGTGGTSGSGNLGGVKFSYFGGGGGGDSAVGGVGSSPGNFGGNGGAGTLGTITGSFYGGGGGGGSDGTSGVGGVGGGGNGSGGTPDAGTANTGGGGGGGGTSAAGGSGIVIVQYAHIAEGPGAVTLSGTVDLQSASTLDAYGAGGLLNVTGLISTSAGSGGLTISSSVNSGGVVRFGSANTYLGNTTVSSGATLRMNTTNALPNGSGKGNLSLSGTLDLNGQATTSLNGLSGAGTIDNNTGASTYALSVGNNNQTSAFGGVIQNTTGTLSLSKTGTGILTLSGTHTYSGNTTVNAGTLKLTSANASNQASTVTIAATGATLELAFSGTDTVNKLFIGSTQMADGIYKSSSNPGAGTAIAQITGAGTLTVGGSPSNYASWANDPSKGNIPGEPATGDFDNDGLTNLTEYALGKNPRTSSQPAGVLSGNIITFTKGADAIANGDVSWVIETSTTLVAGSWTPQVTQPAGDPAATISYTLTPASPAANFARLKVTQN